MNNFILILAEQIFDKRPKEKDLTRIFLPDAHQYYIIGSALEVNVADLMDSSKSAGERVMLVFQRWIASNKEVTWKKILEVCQDYPAELGKAEAELKSFLSSERARESYLQCQ